MAEHTHVGTRIHYGFHLICLQLDNFHIVVYIFRVKTMLFIYWLLACCPRNLLKFTIYHVQSNIREQSFFFWPDFYQKNKYLTVPF